MKVVWELQTATVRDVYEELLKRRKIAYTTVMTMMNILEEKKYLLARYDGSVLCDVVLLPFALQRFAGGG